LPTESAVAIAMASGSGTLARRASASHRANRPKGSDDDAESEDSRGDGADTRFQPTGAIGVAMREDQTIPFATHAV
jgi:hypothetical protein